MNLRCALVEGVWPWHELLEQEGVPSVRMECAALEAGDFSVLIVDRYLSMEERTCVARYLQRGGAVMGAARFLAEVTGIPTRKAWVKYLVDDAKRPWVGLLDVSHRCEIAREAGCVRTETNEFSVFAGECLGGVVVALPFDPAEMLLQEGACQRNFPSPYERLPFERVARCSRTDIRRLIHHGLAFLHHQRLLPYVRLRAWKGNAPAVVALRLDTDKASVNQVERFYEVSRATGVPFTWYLDVGSHEQWLAKFADLAGQEMGIHCHEHRVHSSVSALTRDLQAAGDRMRNAGMSPCGYAAPYGIWSPAVGEVLEQAGMAYSSEMSAGYDGLPFHVHGGGRRYATLQVPVHPISVGALRRAGYAPERMVGYFDAVIKTKAWFNEPLFFYDHPVHNRPEVAASLLDHARGLGAVGTTLGEYAAWWQQRRDVLSRLSLTWSQGAITVAVGGGTDLDIMVEAATEEGAALLPLQNTSVWDTLTIQRTQGVLPEIDLRRAREFDMRSALGMSFAALARRFA